MSKAYCRLKSYQHRHLNLHDCRKPERLSASTADRLHQSRLCKNAHVYRHPKLINNCSDASLLFDSLGLCRKLDQKSAELWRMLVNAGSNAGAYAGKLSQLPHLQLNRWPSLHWWRHLRITLSEQLFTACWVRKTNMYDTNFTSQQVGFLE